MIRMITPLRSTTIKFFFVIPMFLLLCTRAEAQQQASSDVEYVNHLIFGGQYRDALFFLHEMDSTKFSGGMRDSVFHLEGLAYHYLKSVDTAAFYFSKVSVVSPFYVKSNFLGSLNDIYAGKLDLARAKLVMINVDSSALFSQQKKTQLCGIALLERDFKKADTLINAFDYANHVYSDEQTSLTEINKRLQKSNNKSPFKAALLSAAVPGLGKYYAGRKGQALATFFSTMLIGALAAESLYRGGVYSPQFIITGSVFSVFYFGNIMASAYNVKLVKKRNSNLNDNEIRSSVHRPLLRIFN